MPSGASPILWPEILDVRIEGNNAILDLYIPESLGYFPGHFPGVPIVPGVVQIHWAPHYAREKLNLKAPFRHMEAVKFKELLLPRQRLQLYLNYHPVPGKLSFVFRTESHEYSSGRIYFHGQ